MLTYFWREWRKSWETYQNVQSGLTVEFWITQIWISGLLNQLQHLVSDQDDKVTAGN
jgi:hypothetical protein